MWFWERDNDGSDYWFQLHTLSPTAMVGVDTDGDGEDRLRCVCFSGPGCVVV